MDNKVVVKSDMVFYARESELSVLDRMYEKKDLLRQEFRDVSLYYVDDLIKI